MKTCVLVCWAVSLFACGGRAQEVLDRLGEGLGISVAHDNVRARLSGLIDVEGYYFQHPAPGLVDSTDRFLFNPRVALFLDAQLGPSVYVFAQTRLDRGFDAGDRGARVDLNEYALRYTPWEDGHLNVQIGKAATVFGAWTGRHLSWENPFVNAPLPYENVQPVSDNNNLHGNAQGYGRAVSASEKYERIPVIWGPDYTTGLTVSGRRDRFDYAAEVKNAPLASRPGTWSGTESGFERPAFNARLGFRPDLPWNLGASAGGGAYLRPAASGLSRGRDAGDYKEVVFGQDVSYASGHFELWTELFESRFELPRLGNLDAISYYFEAKYKFTPQFFGALRWNQQIFVDAPAVIPSADTLRIDAALTYRFTLHVQWKLQYSFQDGNAPFGDGSTVATQMTMRF